MFRYLFIVLSYLTLNLQAQELSLSARLSQPDGSPLEGVVDLRFELSYSGTPETIVCAKDMVGTTLTNGLFQLGLIFSSAECGGSALTDILEGVPAS